jgi:hypothetical protein
LYVLLTPFGFDSYKWRDCNVCFRDWPLANGYRDDLTIDRFPNQNGNYEPRNCRWVGSREQARNKRTNRLLTAFGETKSMVDWAEDGRCVATYRVLKCRLKRGWSHDRAITEPLDLRRIPLRCNGDRKSTAQSSESIGGLSVIRRGVAEQAAGRMPREAGIAPAS